MPRIEIIPAGWEDSQEKANGDGSPTEDICCGCSVGVDPGDLIDDVAPAAMPEYNGGTIGETDVEHPNYSEGDYQCALCGCKLTEEDD